MNRPRHRSSRYCTALLLTVVYLLITLFPLAPVALCDPRVAHAVTGECSGDCDICGCSLEQRAAGTCCCQQKRDLRKKQRELGTCCDKKGDETEVVLRCSCPCGSQKAAVSLNLPTTELIPFVFQPRLEPRTTCRENPESRRRAPERSGEPPDPPPRITS